MDLKGIAWVGDIYQKFEAMCLEMEDAMYQDTARYVENQVQTVGASVKRFYSDVVLDLHPQFNIDPVKVAAADLSLNPYAHTEISKKLKAKLKGGHPMVINKELIDDTQVIKGKSKSGGVYRRQSVGIKEIVRDNHPPSKKSDALCLVSGNAIKLSSDSKVRGGFEVASDHMTMTSPLASVKGRSSAETGKEVSNHIIKTDVSAAGISINVAASDRSLSVDCVGQNQADLRNTSSVGDLQSDSHADRGTCKELAGDTGLKISSNTGDNNIASEEINNIAKISSNTGDNNITGEEINESCKERSDKSCSPPPEKYDLIESDVEIVEHYDESKLEETCVLVEAEKLHVPQESVKQKSYKKKLRQVFSMKKKSTRKEYEQLGALHGDQQPNLEPEEKPMQVLSKNSNMKKLSSADDHSESEWELL
ncbi:uncharacterized protein [Solanum tuberosum]|uniref:Uncharacterized protein n=1 Tax=Solanum tuberosum TaxID=4113 RepID=M1AD33_SOLTU|nr:PREDICTED: uncharacterized protein LOC102601397 isoform X1 [Solanum tuberosum]XP_006350033.1 PREDICTED: uncharacterized protein LOC102601397 isoform X1 [Solanum tuberosum]XP_006350034.1 PREDICTED: uncharacterized protein LOC102601397 isoform X1 [Solanum tuberosum]XP_006350035.1 PREDICTED: uncharacterized protein LOC102601397 isoform X1 [Solanum tuberosum]XP_006350036.1 PREDICTED: uncharacterized protein LOC102601397 isoform X1 [Solanum tuberosum]